MEINHKECEDLDVDILNLFNEDVVADNPIPAKGKGYITDSEHVTVKISENIRGLKLEWCVHVVLNSPLL